MLKVKTHGIILFTERFADCLTFYRDKLGLPVWFDKNTLVCLRFGDGYLMIETGRHAAKAVKLNSKNPTILRFNVDDVRASAILLDNQGISVEIKQFSWGLVGTFADPDGNICELKNADDPYFN